MSTSSLFKAIVAALLLQLFSTPAWASQCDSDTSELCTAVQNSFRSLLAWSHNPTALLDEQAQWQASTAAACASDCSSVYRARMLQLEKAKELEISSLSGHDVLPLAPDETQHFVGEYQGSDRAAEWIFGRLHITDKVISWTPPLPNEGCTSTYKLVSKKLSSNVWRTFDGKPVNELVYTLALTNKECYPPYPFLLLKFASTVDATMEMAFSQDGTSAEGSIHFYFD